ncbi:MAG: helix-turn-helix domain-containing protein [Armatimonadota bacterium]
MRDDGLRESVGLVLQTGVGSMKVRSLREQRGWSQVELGRRSRIHPADISRIEQGRLQPYRPQLRRLARALKVTEAELSAS